MSVLADAVRRLRADARGGVLVVVGEAGVGKTRLAEHTQEIAVRAGITAVIGRALPEAGGSLLRPFAEALLELTRDRPAPVEDDLAPYAVVLGSLVPAWRAPGWSVPDEPVVVVAEAVLRMLRWATGGAGVVVILEDLHWADDATLAVARYLTDHADEVPVLLVVTTRTGDGRDDVPALLAAGGARICPIGRLTDEQAHTMALACAGAGSSLADSAAAVVRDAEGLRPAVRGPHRGAGGFRPRPRGGPRPARPDPQPIRGARTPAPDAGGRGKPGRHQGGIRWHRPSRPLAGTVVRRRPGGGRRHGGRRGHRRRRPHRRADGWRSLPGLLRPDDATGRRGGDPRRLGRPRHPAPPGGHHLHPAAPGPGGRRLPDPAQNRGSHRATQAGGRRPAARPLLSAGVTTREAEVLDLLADRLSNREIAGLLFLSPRTVEKHVAALLAKLGVEDRRSLARLARSLR